MNFCRICFFALMFCACSAAEQKTALDASTVALKVADCAHDVAEEFLGQDVTSPDVAIKLADELSKCLPLPEPERK